MNRFLLLIFAIQLTITTAAQSKLTSNTLLDLLPRQACVAGAPGVAGASEDMLSAYIKYSSEECPQQLRDMGVEVRTVGRTVLTALIPISLVEEVAALEAVECIETARPARMQMNLARTASGVDRVHAGEAPLATPMTGRGVIVGVIDGGVDFTHPNFFAADGTTLRIKRVWCQDDEKGTPPETFGYGSEYATQEAITAKATDLSYYSHGCHVMGIAAGSYMESPYHGIATEADLAFSNFKEVDTGISDAISYLFGYADAMDQPAVINMSLGTEMGPHDGTSLRDQLIDELTGPGRIVVGASGNNALINMHISKTFAANDTLFAGMGFLDGMSGIGELQIWGDPGSNLKVRVCTIDKATMLPVYQSRAFNCSRDYSGTVTLEKPYDQSSGYFNIATQVSPLNGKPMAHIELNLADYKPDKVIALIILADEGHTVHAWANENYCCFMQHLPVMDMPDNKYGICEIGGTGKSTITVGSYSTRATMEMLDGTTTDTGFPVGDIAPYSNIGPTPDGRMKPDVAAPGSLIVSSLNGSNSAADQVASVEWNGKKYYYGAYQGTSMASPHVAGIVATWLQAYPLLSPDDVRQVLTNTSRRDEMTGPEANNTWGCGKVDAYAGLVYVLKNFASAGVTEPLTDNDWAMTIVGGELRLLCFRSVCSTQIIIYAPDGSLAKSVCLGATACGDEISVATGDLAPGVYIVDVATPDRRKTAKFIRN